MDEQTQSSNPVVEATAPTEAPTPAIDPAPVEVTPTPEAPAPEPYLEPSPLQKAEAAVEEAVAFTVENFEKAVDRIHEVLGQHGHAAALALEPTQITVPVPVQQDQQ